LLPIDARGRRSHDARMLSCSAGSAGCGSASSSRTSRARPVGGTPKYSSPTILRGAATQSCDGRRTGFPVTRHAISPTRKPKVKEW
jgi:hypothetical protein